jgi:hypothetical protein
MAMGRENRETLVLQARAALIMAALRRSIVTYKELGFAIGLKDIELRNEMPRVLEQLANDSAAAARFSRRPFAVGGAP